MNKYSGTQTEKNLYSALCGESKARNLYTYFASAAKKEGLEQIAAIFLLTAENEKEHAKLWAKELELIGSTEENLRTAADNEFEEWSGMYRDFAAAADTEGFHELAEKFRKTAFIENEHEKRYRRLLTNVVNGEVFRKNNAHVWVCRNCGYIYFGSEAPEECPACSHPQAYFEIRSENF